jgi:hypothetical protein
MGFQALARPKFSAAAVIELAHREAVIGFEPAEEDEAAATEIEAAFRRKLMGLRRLPQHERAPALRAARQWRVAALRALREKRARDRHARYVLWRQRLPPPRQPG